jgi:hypothetical protein
MIQVWARSAHSVDENGSYAHRFFEMSESQNINYLPEDRKAIQRFNCPLELTRATT